MESGKKKRTEQKNNKMKNAAGGGQIMWRGTWNGSNSTSGQPKREKKGYELAEYGKTDKNENREYRRWRIREYKKIINEVNK